MDFIVSMVIAQLDSFPFARAIFFKRFEVFIYTNIKCVWYYFISLITTHSTSWIVPISHFKNSDTNCHDWLFWICTPLSETHNEYNQFSTKVTASWLLRHWYWHSRSWHGAPLFPPYIWILASKFHSRVAFPIDCVKASFAFGNV